MPESASVVVSGVLWRLRVIPQPGCSADLDVWKTDQNVTREQARALKDHLLARGDTKENPNV